MISHSYSAEQAEQIVDILFSHDSLEGALRDFFHLNPASSAHTSELLELLQTEAALLQAQIVQAPSPDRESLRLSRRYASALGFIGALTEQGTAKSGFPPKGRGARAAMVALAKDSVAAASDRLSDIAIEASKRPAGLPPMVSSLGQIKVKRPLSLPTEGSIQADRSSAPVLPLSSGTSSSSSGDSSATLRAESIRSSETRRVKLSQIQETLDQFVEKHSRPGSVAVSKAGSEAGSRHSRAPQPGAGLGSFLESKPPSLKADAESVRRDILAVRREIIRERADKLKAELERTERELIECKSRSTSPRTQSSQSEPDEKPIAPPPKTPRTKPRQVIGSSAELAMLQSPSADESQLLALRSQIAEVESRVLAERKLAASPPEDQLKAEIANMRVELDMMRKPPVHLLSILPTLLLPRSQIASLLLVRRLQ